MSNDPHTHARVLPFARPVTPRNEQDLFIDLLIELINCSDDRRLIEGVESLLKESREMRKTV